MAALDLADVGLWVMDVRSGQRVSLLTDLDWRVEVGEHWAVLGPNGAGKSSLLSLCAAMRHPSQGSVTVLGERLGRTDMRALRAHVAVVDAATAARLPATLTLHDVALTGLSATVLTRAAPYTDAESAAADDGLAAVGLADLRVRRFGDCSQGERARALLARALLCDPALLLLDEASAGLDLPAREALLAAVGTAARDRPSLTSVTVTHHVEELPATTSHALLVRGGRALAAGPVAEALTGPLLSECFGLPVRLTRFEGRYAATAAASWTP